MAKKLILGSSSPYRRALLERLGIPFERLSPDIDESHNSGESPHALVERLSKSKAEAIKCKLDHGEYVIISSDQVALLDNQILGKPHTVENAIKQLSTFSENKVSFLTGLCLLDTKSHKLQFHISEYHVYFRRLSQAEIARYVELEQPLNCAGSFKCEGLGVTLFDKMEGDDPNSLIGLPLIELSKMLRNCGINPLKQ